MGFLNRVAIKNEAKNSIKSYANYTEWTMIQLPFIIAPIVFSFLTRMFSMSIDTQSLDNSEVDSWEELAEVLHSISVSPAYSILQMLQTLYNILIIPLSIAISIYFLRCLRNRFAFKASAAYNDAKVNLGRYLVIGFVTGLIEALYSFLFIIPGVIKYYQYYFVSFIIGDNPRLSGKEARELSRKITDGFKGDLFVLDLSFFGWYWLTGITANVLSIYTTPYITTTKAMYYENLKNRAIETGIAHPTMFGEIPENMRPDTGVNSAPLGTQPYSQPFAPAAPTAPAQPTQQPSVPYEVPTPVIFKANQDAVANTPSEPAAPEMPVTPDVPEVPQTAEQPFVFTEPDAPEEPEAAEEPTEADMPEE